MACQSKLQEQLLFGTIAAAVVSRVRSGGHLLG